LPEAESAQELAGLDARRLRESAGVADGRVLDHELPAVDGMEVDRGFVQRDEGPVHFFRVNVPGLVRAVVVVDGDI
jgi:hypothetical protein